MSMNLFKKPWDKYSCVTKFKIIRVKKNKDINFTLLDQFHKSTLEE